MWCSCSTALNNQSQGGDFFHWLGFVFCCGWEGAGFHFSTLYAWGMLNFWSTERILAIWNMQLAAGNSEPGVTAVVYFLSGLEIQYLAYVLGSPRDADSVCGCYCLKPCTLETLNTSWATLYLFLTSSQTFTVFSTSAVERETAVILSTMNIPHNTCPRHDAML